MFVVYAHALTKTISDANVEKKISEENNGCFVIILGNVTVFVYAVFRVLLVISCSRSEQFKLRLCVCLLLQRISRNKSYGNY